MCYEKRFHHTLKTTNDYWKSGEMNNIDIYLTTEEVHIERDVDRKRKIVELKNCTPKNLLYN